MEPRNDLSTGAPQALVRFLERVHKSFSHDLGAPLGSIVNYASVLESGQAVQSGSSDPDLPQAPARGVQDVRELGRRIRTNAMRAARMIQLLATATGLASRPLHAGSTDFLPLAKSVLMDAGGRGQVRGVGAGETVELDPDLIGFVWRAYLALENDARGGPTDEAALEVSEQAGYVEIEMRCTANGSPPGERSDATNFMQQNVGPARMESSMGFGLAEDLVRSHGGEFEVFGRPGRSSALRLRFPLRA